MSRHKLREDVAVPREFKNEFEDFSGQQVIASNKKLCDAFVSQLHENINVLLHRLETGYKGSAVDEKDYTVYTGTAGVALLYFHLYQRIDGATQNRYLHPALSYIEGALKRLRQRGVSYLCGDAGPLALGSVIYHITGQTKSSQDCLERLLSLSQQVLSDSSVPDEVLCGRSGYLLSLLFVRRHLGEDAVPQEIVHQVCTCILNSGRELSRIQKSSSPLMFEWHEKKYLGAAHGLVGILHTLLSIKDEAVSSALSSLIRPTLDFLMTLKFPSGNYPSSIGSSNGDLLVHWCHGAPGWIHLFIIAYKVFRDVKFLEAAKECAQVLWQRGILRKGYGLCHGVSGNAYGFLAMYQLTSDPLYLYRATKFAEWCFDYGEHGCPTPDRPYSLFEGLAGTIYFMVDMLDPDNAKFPVFVV